MIIGLTSLLLMTINIDYLDHIDDAVETAISEEVAPGAVVLITKDGETIKEKSYGLRQKYDMGELLHDPPEMTTDTIFDLASVSKVMATTQGIMYLEEQGLLDVNEPVHTYVQGFEQQGKEEITVADLLSHTSGLPPWKATWFHASNREELLSYIKQLPLDYETGSERVYSDIGFMTLGYIIESITEQPLDIFLEEIVYEPLGMHDTGFNPSSDQGEIAATSWGNPYEYRMVDETGFGYEVEEDPEEFAGWRDYTLLGEVNDGNAFYSSEGVAGHAGLFSTASDLAILGQEMLNNNDIVTEYVTNGYGFERSQAWYMGDYRSENAFGHTGFTGTQIILDPEYDLQIILLTNKQNNGVLENGSYASTGSLSQEVSNIVYEAIDRGQIFYDVSKNFWAYEEITRGHVREVINGYSDGTFQPNEEITRSQASRLLAEALDLEIPEKVETTPFADVPATHPNAAEIVALHEAGVVIGRQDGTMFEPQYPISRQQTASMLVRAYDLQDLEEDKTLHDLSEANSVHRENIQILAQNGITVVSNGLFRPNEQVTRAQFAVFLDRAWR